MFSHEPPKFDSKKPKHNHINPHLASAYPKTAGFISMNIYAAIITYLPIISARVLYLLWTARRGMPIQVGV